MNAEISIATGIEQLFLRFCSNRTNEYALNPGAKPGSHYVPIPDTQQSM